MAFNVLKSQEQDFPRRVGGGRVTQFLLVALWRLGKVRSSAQYVPVARPVRSARVNVQKRRDAGFPAAAAPRPRADYPLEYPVSVDVSPREKPVAEPARVCGRYAGSPVGWLAG